MPNRARPAAFARRALPALALLAAFLVAAAAACLRGPKRQFRHSSFRQHSPQPPRFRRAPARHSYSTPQNACCARGPARRTAARIGRGRQPRAQLRSSRPRRQIARRACVPRAGRRQAAAAMRFGAGGGGGGLAVALLPPPRVSPAPPHSRVPRGHAAGHFAADSYMAATRPTGGGGSTPPGLSARGTKGPQARRATGVGASQKHIFKHWAIRKPLPQDATLQAAATARPRVFAHCLAPSTRVRGAPTWVNIGRQGASTLADSFTFAITGAGRRRRYIPWSKKSAGGSLRGS